MKSIQYLILLFCAIFISQSANAQIFPPDYYSSLVDESRISQMDLDPSFNPEWKPFYHGVASGDPLEDRVIIWTRVTPDTLNGETIEVDWRMATDPDLGNIVQSGITEATVEKDYTVKVDVTGLSPGTTYYFGFTALGSNSLTGKTKTTPVGGDVIHLKFAVLTGSNFQSGFFTTYGKLAKRTDLDAIIHVGDYIYEYADSHFGDSTLFDERPILPANELITLDDYRLRYSTYHLDTNLVRVHQQHPFITVWDDHESANNSWPGGAANHDEMTEGNWDDRLAASKQAYFEWLPIRENADQKIYRSISYGNLMDLFMLDTRQEGRDEQIYNLLDPALQDNARTMLGAEQKTWLKDQMMNSTAQWKVIGNQVVFSDLNTGWLFFADTTLNYYSVESQFLDNWNGYPAERSEIIEFIGDNTIDNVLFISGDMHTAFAFDVTYPVNEVNFQDIPALNLEDFPFYTPSENYNSETGEGSVAVEFVSPSMTSPNFNEIYPDLLAQIIEIMINNEVPIPGTTIFYGNPNPHMKYVDLRQHGYIILDVKPDSTQANWYYSPIRQPNQPEAFGEAWYTLSDENHLRQAQNESAPKDVQDIPAPLDPPGIIISTKTLHDAGPFTLLGLYPNPFNEVNTLQYALNEPAHVSVSLLDVNGRFIKLLMDEMQQIGVYTLKTLMVDLAPGTYFYKVQTGNQIYMAKVIHVPK